MIIKRAKVWIKVPLDEKYMPEIHLVQSFDFAPALGRALKDVFVHSSRYKCYLENIAR